MVALLERTNGFDNPATARLRAGGLHAYDTAQLRSGEPAGLPRERKAIIFSKASANSNCNQKLLYPKAIVFDKITQKSFLNLTFWLFQVPRTSKIESDIIF